ncbi:ankyrin repeat protein [Acanthamoeba polyphaga moumouvirus]|uniref:Ankyrin repeat protein n=1 Tax=Acanthamoeba polyphaga moumouvirus TaxID=1269028 RepID=L7RB72_9VIRU|nr:ankyrin repeat protein [Acanthamoeba polyphaga moumouvirus]AGC01684.1 ankyrin repeat protein [Acanthamoeba polyphaga moumouvirus]
MYFLLSQKSNSYNIIDVKYVFRKLYLNNDSELIQVEPDIKHPDFILKEMFPGHFITNYINTITKYDKNDISTIKMLLDQKIEFGYKKLYKWVLQNNRIDIVKLLHCLNKPMHKYSSCKKLFQYINNPCLDYILINNDFFNFNLEHLLLELVNLFDKSYRINNDATIILKYMLNNEINFKYQDVYFCATKNDYLSIILLMLEYNITPNNNLIITALKYNADEIFKCLYQLGFTNGINENIKYCSNPIIIKYLIEQEVIKENNLIELLNHSCVNNNIRMIKFLIKNEINIEDITEQTLNKSKNNSNIINFLVKKSDRICNYFIKNNPEILLDLMHQKYKQSVKKLITNGIDINYNSSRTLSSVILMNDLDILNILVFYGFNIPPISKADLSCLCEYCDVDFLEYFIKNIPNLDIEYCLEKAIFYENKKIIKYLLQIVEYDNIMAKIIINHYYCCGKVYFLSDIRKPYICSPLQETIIEIIRGNTSNVKKIILDHGLDQNLEIAFASCIGENTDLLDFLMDCNEDDYNYINWLFIFSSNNMTTLQHLLKKLI